MVDALRHRWGVSDRAGGIGKTVWPELKAPDLVPASSTREIAAIVVRTGQHIRVWGTWHAVRRVRTAHHATSGLSVVLSLTAAHPSTSTGGASGRTGPDVRETLCASAEAGLS